ncbi:putative signal transducing protein [Vibrio sp. YIC-376]|uniref:putative signal transducing protein n=1 Tax=Vibrio sp. YIC-376 TaxID=3136162 RepID=UPI00402ADB9C
MKIFIANNPAEAHIVCELLKMEQIHCEVRGEGIFGLKGELPFSDDTDPYVWLFDSEQQIKAMAIVAAYQTQAQPNTYQDWQCPECSEMNEGQFGACWQCGYRIDERS